MSISLAGINFDELMKTIPLNPKFLPEGGSSSSKIGGMISYIIPYLFVIAGLILLFFLIAGGLQMMTGANDDKAVASARAKITSALTGFLLLFCSYWIFRLVLKVLGLENF